jgi:hypothetical protein
MCQTLKELAANISFHTLNKQKGEEYMRQKMGKNKERKNSISRPTCLHQARKFISVHKRPPLSRALKQNHIAHVSTYSFPSYLLPVCSALSLPLRYCTKRVTSNCTESCGAVIMASVSYDSQESSDPEFSAFFLSTRIIRKVTSGELLTKQALRENIMYKNTYLSYSST